MRRLTERHRRHCVSPTCAAAAALHFLGDHAALFPRAIFKDARSLYDNLQALYLHKNADVRRAASRAVDAVLTVVRHAVATGARQMRDCGSQ